MEPLAPVLDDRLALIAAMVRPGRAVADIGADHGHLVTWLVATGACPRGVAADLNAAPLAHAARTAKAYGVAERIALIQCDGLSGLCECDVDDIVIAGMGGDTIAQILEAAAWHAPDKRFLLQPMTHAAQLRKWLCAAGYAIEDERAARSGRFCYSVMVARYTGAPTPCTELFAQAGLLAGQHTPEARAYLLTRARAVEKKARGLSLASHNEHEAQACALLAQQLRACAGEEP